MRASSRKQHYNSNEKWLRLNFPARSDIETELSGKVNDANGGLWSLGPPSLITTISWNYRGLGPPCIIQVLKELVQLLKPKLVFIIETMISRAKLDRVRSLLGFEGVFTVDPIRYTGGLALLWKDKDSVKLLSFSSSHIDVTVNILGMVK